MCTVVNKHKDAFDVYIGRGSKWGNPFPITKTQTRGAVIQKYHEKLVGQIRTGEVTVTELKGLYGKRLGCFCSPKPCHGDAIRAAVLWAIQQPGG